MDARYFADTLTTGRNRHTVFFGEGAKGNADFIALVRTDVPALKLNRNI